MTTVTNDTTKVEDQKLAKNGHPPKTKGKTDEKSADDAAANNSNPEEAKNNEASEDLSPSISPQRRNEHIARMLQLQSDTSVDSTQAPDTESTQSSGVTEEGNRFTYGHVVEITDSTCNLRHDYILGRKLGSGGYSEVRLAKLRNRPDLPRFAMKIVDLKKPKAARIERQPYWEIEILKKMSFSRRIIRMFEYKIVENDVLFMVLEWAGKSLEQLNRKKALGKSNYAKYYFRYCALSVLDIHSEEIIHCDLKPSNFIRCGRTLKVIDFGCATPLGPLNDAVIRRKALGTTRFMSPEYLRDKVASKATDIWALGCILFWLATCQKAFRDPRNELRKAICTRQVDLSTIVDVELFQLLKQIFDHDRKKRPTCEQVLTHAYLALDMSSSTGENTKATATDDQKSKKETEPNKLKNK